MHQLHTALFHMMWNLREVCVGPHCGSGRRYLGLFIWQMCLSTCHARRGAQYAVSSASVLGECLSHPVVFCSSRSSVHYGHAELNGRKSVFMLKLTYSRHTKSKNRKSPHSTLGTAWTWWGKVSAVAGLLACRSALGTARGPWLSPHK